MFLIHIFILLALILITQIGLRFIFQRYSIKDSFQHRFLYFLIILLYFVVMLDYEGKHGLSIKIPTLWAPKELFMASMISLSGLFILLLILWFDYSMDYHQGLESKPSTNMEAEVSSYSGLPQWVGIMILAVISGVVEELIFRYYMIDRIGLLTPHLDWAVGLSSFLYGLTFYFRSGWMSVCFRGIVGFLLSVLYIMTENILFVILTHCLEPFHLFDY